MSTFIHIHNVVIYLDKKKTTKLIGKWRLLLKLDCFAHDKEIADQSLGHLATVDGQLKTMQSAIEIVCQYIFIYFHKPHNPVKI